MMLDFEYAGQDGNQSQCVGRVHQNYHYEK